MVLAAPAACVEVITTPIAHSSCFFFSVYGRYYYYTQKQGFHQAVFDIFIVFLLFVVFQETFQLLFFIFFVFAFFDGLTNLAHHCVVEIQIVQNTETHSQHLFCF